MISPLHAVRTAFAWLTVAPVGEMRTEPDRRLGGAVMAAVAFGLMGTVGFLAAALGTLPGLLAQAVALVRAASAAVGGKGGGKPDMAMAGGTDASGLPKALQSVQGWVAERV